jgi:glycosyltransferase involved in cell wall biosynthesis
MTRIVGVGLFRDEDLFVEHAVRSVWGFCDELILVDHRSKDRTPEILQHLVAESPITTTFHRIDDPSISHDLIKGYAGQDVWVFGVDGDELYDPSGLAAFKPQLLAGVFDDWWLIRSNALHVVELDRQNRTARGYLSPPAASMVKLHNFSLIESWDGVHPERLHGADGLRFRLGREGLKLDLGSRYSWDESPLRCLHVCFLRRSSLDRPERTRSSIRDRNAPARLPVRAWRRLRGAPPAWKLEHYRVGPLHEVSTTPFAVPEE